MCVHEYKVYKWQFVIANRIHWMWCVGMSKLLQIHYVIRKYTLGGGAHVHLWPFDYLCYLRPHHGLGLMGISLTTRLKVLFLKEYFFGEVCNVKFMMMMMFWIEGLGLPFFLEGSPLSTWPTSQLWTNCSSIFFYGSTIFVELMTCNYQMVFISKKINMIIFSLIRKQRNIIRSWNYLTTNFHSLKLKEFI